MKFLLCFAILMLSSISFGQKIIHITPEQLLENIKTNSKATVIQYWVPNCTAAKDIVTEFKRLEDRYSDKVDFYFIGITNKDSLVDASLKATSYNHTIYVADASVNNDISSRKESFSLLLCRLLGSKEKDFITLYLDKNDKIVYKGDTLEIKEKKLKKITR